MEDHVHCFIGLKPVVSVSELMKTVKGKSSKYINDHKLTPGRFEWQEGYGVFSYSQKNVDTVYKYIQHQEEHHKVQTFREEYLELLKEFRVEFDEQYIFQNLISMYRAYGTLSQLRLSTDQNPLLQNGSSLRLFKIKK